MKRNTNIASIGIHPIAKMYDNQEPTKSKSKLKDIYKNTACVA